MSPTSTAPRRRAVFGFIFACGLMNSVSFGIMIPVLPNLIKQFMGGDTAAAAQWTSNSKWLSLTDFTEPTELRFRVVALS